MPIIVRPCAWTAVGWLSDLQVRPIDGKPLNAARGNAIDKMLTQIVAEIHAWATDNKSVPLNDDSPLPIFESSSAHLPVSSTLLSAASSRQKDDVLSVTKSIQHYILDKIQDWKHPKSYEALRVVLNNPDIDIDAAYFKPYLSSISLGDDLDIYEQRNLKAFIVGSAGAGKSLLMYHLAYTQASSYLSSQDNFSSPIPFLVNLPDHWQAIYQQGAQALIGLLENELGHSFHRLKAINFLFLFDGLDELRGYHVNLSLVVDYIRAFVRSFRNNGSVLISCREEVADQDAVIPFGWAKIQIRPLYERRWVLFLKHVFGEDDGGYIIGKIDSFLADQPRWGDGIVNNPLHLTQLGMLLLKGILPQKYSYVPATLSNECMKLLLVTHGTGNSNMKPNQYTPEQKLRLLTLIALKHVNGQEQNLRDIIESDEGKRWFRGGFSTKVLYEELTIRSGILDITGRFQHESYAESLVAVFMAESLLQEERMQWGKVLANDVLDSKSLADSLDVYFSSIELRKHFEIRDLICGYFDTLNSDEFFSMLIRLCNIISSHGDPTYINNCGEILVKVDPELTATTIIDLLSRDRAEGVTGRDVSLIWVLGEIRGGRTLDTRKKSVSLLTRVLSGDGLKDRGIDCLTAAYHSAWAIEKVCTAIRQVVIGEPCGKYDGVELLQNAKIFSQGGGIEDVMHNPDLLGYKPWMIVVLQKFLEDHSFSEQAIVDWLISTSVQFKFSKSKIDFDPSSTVCYNSCWLLGQLLNVDWYNGVDREGVKHVLNWDSDCKLRQLAVATLWELFIENESSAHSDGYLSSGITEALGKIGTSSAYDYLLQLLEVDKKYFYRIRFRAIEGIRRILARCMNGCEDRLLSLSKETLDLTENALNRVKITFPHPRIVEEVNRVYDVLNLVK